jgi:hypothetical protein
MSSIETHSTKSILSKAELQTLVVPNDASISFVKLTNLRSEWWTNFSQIYHKIKSFFNHVKRTLKWTSTNGTRVMTHHNCLKTKLN